MDDLHAMTEQNRRAWNEIAGVRNKSFPGADFFAGGGVTLASREVEAARQAFGEIRGLRVIHLQCATGEDTLSWSVLGAQADGVDIADDQIVIARQKASQAGLSTRFHAADVYALPEALPEGWLGEGYDLVFTGGGAIVWLPDLERWARVVASLLRKGGRLLLADEHPLSGCLWVEEGKLQITDDYFRRAQPMEVMGWYHFKGGEDAKELKYEFIWPLGDIVTALAKAGLFIERLEEIPGGPEWQFGTEQGQMASLPGRYMVVAKRIA